jgi:hypothetical protein
MVDWFMTNAEPEIEKAIDAICLLGCEVVSAYICALKNGETRPEYQALDADQRSGLLDELESIMTVYQARQGL